MTLDFVDKQYKHYIMHFSYHEFIEVTTETDVITHTINASFGETLAEKFTIKIII